MTLFMTAGLRCALFVLPWQSIINNYYFHFSKNIDKNSKLTLNQHKLQMHFKFLISYIFRQFISHTLVRSIQDVTPHDFYWYAQYLRTHHRGLANTVRDMFDILFGFPPKSQDVCDFVSSWIRVTHPLVNVSIKNN